MKCSLVLSFAVGILLWCSSDLALAQTAGSGAPKTWIGIVKLSPPIYPPIAREARILGDVTLRMEIRRDGTVASAEVVSGPVMLKQAALESAQKSTFSCENCSQEMTEYFLTYTFGFRRDNNCGFTRLRSPKCLYLWRCGKWEQPPDRPPVLGESLDRVVILADTMCVETSHSRQ